MPPDLGDSKKSKKSSKYNLKITQDDQRLTINLIDRNQSELINDASQPLIDSIVMEPPPRRVDSLQRNKRKPKQKKNSKNCLNIFERNRSPSPDPQSYKHLKEIISEANDNWSHFFLPLIHLADIDPGRLKTNRLFENFNHYKNLLSKKSVDKIDVIDEDIKLLETSPSQLSVSDSQLNKLHTTSKTFTYDEKNSSSSSGSCSDQTKLNRLDALKNEIDKTINEISTFKNEVLNSEKLQTNEIGVNTDISMSNAVFKIKYEDEEEDEEDDTLKHESLKDTEKLMYPEPFVESPSETSSRTYKKYTDLPALTLLKNLNRKYNLNISSMNDTDVSTPGITRKVKPKLSNLETDSLDELRSRLTNETSDYLLDDDNIFKKIFSRNLNNKSNYVNLEPLKKKTVSSSSLTSSSSDSYEFRRASKVYKKRDSLNEETKSKRHSLKKLPVVDFATSKRNSNEFKLKMIPLKRTVTIDQNRFHCCCCKCSCTDVPIYQTVTTKTTAKLSQSSENSESSEGTKKNDMNLSSYYFKSTKNHRKKNEFGLSSDIKRGQEAKNFDFNYFMLDSLEEESQNTNQKDDEEFDFIKNLMQQDYKDEFDETEKDMNLVKNNLQYILDSLHRPHSAFQFNEERVNQSLNTTLNDFDLNSSKSSKKNQNNTPRARSQMVPDFKDFEFNSTRTQKQEQLYSPPANFNGKAPIRFPIPITKESDYENFLSNKIKIERKHKRYKKVLKKTNNYYIHYPISSTDSSVLNSPSLMNSRRRNQNRYSNPVVGSSKDSKSLFKPFFNPEKELDSPTLTDVNSTKQSESVLLNSYKIV